MKTRILINDAPYGNERVYNALRLAHALRKHAADGEMTVFLMADAAFAAKAGQATPEGHYNIEHMLGRVVSAGGRVLVCGTCMNARGLQDSDLIVGAARSTMDELAEATLAADKVLTF